MNHEFEEKTVSSKEIFSGKVVRLQVDEVKLPNGKSATREIVKHPGAVGIIPITNDNKIVFVEQYRKPLERALVEIPAGKLEKGESPEVTARRELEEETGYECETLDWLISFYTSPGFSNEIIHMYVAKGLKKKEHAASPDEDEFVRLLELDLSEALEYLNDQRIYDAKTAYALTYLQLHKETLR